MKAFLAGEISKIDNWPHGIKLARWKDHDIVSNEVYNTEWTHIFTGLHLAQGEYICDLNKT